MTPIVNRIVTRRPVILAALLLFGILAGCGPSQPATSIEYYKPAPPLLATATPDPAGEAPLQALSTPVCIDNLTYISDVTIPDGTEVEANATLDKRWEVKNSGNCNWDDRYRLRLSAGPALGSAQEQTLFPARAGIQVIIQILFQAPAETGSYRSAWQAYNPDGQPFGDPIFIDFVVK